jgi:hypothetical protein
VRGVGRRAAKGAPRALEPSRARHQGSRKQPQPRYWGLARAGPLHIQDVPALESLALRPSGPRRLISHPKPLQLPLPFALPTATPLGVCAEALGRKKKALEIRVELRLLGPWASLSSVRSSSPAEPQGPHEALNMMFWDEFLFWPLPGKEDASHVGDGEAPFPLKKALMLLLCVSQHPQAAIRGSRVELGCDGWLCLSGTTSFLSTASATRKSRKGGKLTHKSHACVIPTVIRSPKSSQQYC